MAFCLGVLVYFSVGLLTLGSVVPPSNTIERKHTFFIVLLLWPILWLLVVTYLFRFIVNLWLKSKKCKHILKTFNFT